MQKHHGVNMDKAICEMTLEELNAEYLYCLQAAQDDVLEDITRRYYYDRAQAVKMQVRALQE